MPECAFCSSTAKLSAEHVVSQWMEALFVGPMKAKITDSAGRDREWSAPRMDWKARVVCATCNNTWMSRIEATHAEPVMTPLIKGEVGIPIGKPEARSLALFAFKTAVVLDHAHGRGKKPFFSTAIRYKFRTNLTIPGNTQMWLCGYSGHKGRLKVQSVYHSGELSPTYPLQMYVCTYAIGHLVFQVLSVKSFGWASFAPLPGFENLAVPLWPNIPKGFIWPPRPTLSSVGEFERLGERWRSVMPLTPVV